MGKYNYLEAVTADVKQYINAEIEMSEYSDRDELEEYLNEKLFCSSVTGKDIGSYTLSPWQAEDNLCHNLDLLLDTIHEFGVDSLNILEEPESCDVIIRCYQLNSAISKALDELWKELEEN